MKCPMCRKRGSEKYEGYCKACYDFAMTFDFSLVYPDKAEKEFEGLFSNTVNSIRKEVIK